VGREEESKKNARSRRLEALAGKEEEAKKNTEKKKSLMGEQKES